MSDNLFDNLMETLHSGYSQSQQHEFIDFLRRLTTASDQELGKLCEQFIWLSAYANNNPRSNYHRMCDACADECRKRDRSDIYSEAHKAVSAGLR